jgi:4,5-DOPA dioxygenase extradiol
MLPTVFLSHGSPMHALHAGAAGRAWADLGRRLPRPRAVLIASAHWQTELPMVSTAAAPETIHDFGGFPPELYELRYAAPGAPHVAQRALDLLKAAGVRASANGCHGLDHGAWVPLMHLYPGADLPVTQLSVQPSLDAAHHMRVGRALAPLAREGVLVIGSGHMTHNLGEWMQYVRRYGRSVADTPPAAYVDAFRTWVDRALRHDDRSALAAWFERAPTRRARIRAASTCFRCRSRLPPRGRRPWSSAFTRAWMRVCWRRTPICSGRRQPLEDGLARGEAG